MAYPNLRGMFILIGLIAGLWLAGGTVGAAGETFEVQMLNEHHEDPNRKMVFVPQVLVVQPGDTVKFVATDRSHNSVSIDKMNPEGAIRWKGKINEAIEITFETPGHYAYHCLPHKAMGMVGVIIVDGEGALDHIDVAKTVKQRGKAKKVWDDIWTEIDALGL